MQTRKESNASTTNRLSARHVPGVNLPSIHLRAVAVGAAKLEDEVGVSALVEDGVLATGVARRVSVRAVARGARRARDAVAVAGAASEEFEALGTPPYGERGAGGAIGPNEALIFVVDLVDVR